MASLDTIPPGATYAVLGALLSYPDEMLLDALPEAQTLLRGDRALTRDARAGLDQFIEYCAQRELFTLQENYVALFDRGQAMVDLLRMYEEHGLHLAAGELPDYLPVFLEYLSRVPAAQARGLLAETGEILQSITAQLARRGSPYSFVVGALLPLAGAGKAETPDTLNDDDAQSPPSPADYRALDAAWADEPVRFVGAATPAQAPVHFYDSCPGAASPAGRNATRENQR